jgi:hypothetical protein
MVFDLLVYDSNEDFDDLPSTLTTVGEWLSKRPFFLSSESTVGLRIADGTNDLVTESFGRLQETSQGCRAAAHRLAEGCLALLRTSTDNPGVYLLLSAEDPVRVTWVHERPPCGDVFPFLPGRSFDPPDAPERLLEWAEAEVARLLSPSGNPAYDRARGLNLRIPRGPLIEDLNTQAQLADEMHRTLTGAG